MMAKQAPSPGLLRTSRRPPLFRTMFITDRQSQARALAHFLRGKKGVEDAVDIFGRYARTAVNHFYPGLVEFP